MAKFAIPNGDGTYQILDDNTPDTFSIGVDSFPPPFLKDATSDTLNKFGILSVQITAMPDPTQNNVTGSSVSITNGVATQIWQYNPIPQPTPLSPTQLAQQTQQQLVDEAYTTFQQSTNGILSYLVSGQSIPADISSYMQALWNIATGMDTQSTALPTPPPELVTQPYQVPLAATKP